MPRRIGNPQRRRRHFIREWREFRELTQQQLADRISAILRIDDISKATISRIEDLKQGYTQDSLEAIADALGTHPAALLTRPPSDADRYAAAPPRQRKSA
jgi:transcriptional regulator with XRE-family HTH domain